MMEMERELPLRIVVTGPPAGVDFAVKRGRDGLLPPTRRTADAIVFDLTVRVGERDGMPNFLGEFAQGTPADRFVYVNSGSRAGQAGSRWERRAKVKLSGITRELIDRTLAQPATVLEARFAGTAGDGGPSCATVPLLDGGWRLARSG